MVVVVVVGHGIVVRRRGGRPGRGRRRERRAFARIFRSPAPVGRCSIGRSGGGGGLRVVRRAIGVVGRRGSLGRSGR